MNENPNQQAIGTLAGFAYAIEELRRTISDTVDLAIVGRESSEPDGEARGWNHGWYEIQIAQELSQIALAGLDQFMESDSYCQMGDMEKAGLYDAWQKLQEEAKHIEEEALPRLWLMNQLANTVVSVAAEVSRFKTVRANAIGKIGTGFISSSRAIGRYRKNLENIRNRILVQIREARKLVKKLLSTKTLRLPDTEREHVLMVDTRLKRHYETFETEPSL